MKRITFNAFCPWEIGDVVETKDGVKRIDEIACVTYASDGRSEFSCRFVGDKKFYTIKNQLN